MVYSFLENSRSLGCVGSLPQVLAGGVNRSNDGHPPNQQRTEFGVLHLDTKRCQVM